MNQMQPRAPESDDPLDAFETDEALHVLGAAIVRCRQELLWAARWIEPRVPVTPHTAGSTGAPA